jgi:hypothetical protein
MSLAGAFEAHTLRKLRTIAYVAALLVLLASGCIVDDKHRCDENQVLVTGTGLSSDVCQCAPGATPNPRGYGCIVCGANEIAQNGACACAAGYARGGDAGVCELSSIGLACTGEGTCQQPFPYCTTNGTDKYCTAQNCTVSSCPTGYACEKASPNYCKKLPVGIGKSCATMEDCAGGEANVCDTQQTHSCLYTGCANGQVKCPGYWGCCDLSQFAPGFSVCRAPEALTADGQCTIGTLVVTP